MNKKQGAPARGNRFMRDFPRAGIDSHKLHFTPWGGQRKTRGFGEKRMNAMQKTFLSGPHFLYSALNAFFVAEAASASAASSASRMFSPLVSRYASMTF